MVLCHPSQLRNDKVHLVHKSLFLQMTCHRPTWQDNNDQTYSRSVRHTASLIISKVSQSVITHLPSFWWQYRWGHQHNLLALSVFHYIPVMPSLSAVDPWVAWLISQRLDIACSIYISGSIHLRTPSGNRSNLRGWVKWKEGWMGRSLCESSSAEGKKSSSKEEEEEEEEEDPVGQWVSE